MDHDLYDYSALPMRAAGPPGLAHGLSAFAVLFLEHWELSPPADALRDPRLVGEFGSFSPDYRSWSQREYGLRVGIFRVIDALREAGIRPVIAANAMAVQRLPGLVEIFRLWGCDWIAHGLAATRLMHGDMPLERQRASIEQSMDAIESCSGQRPIGWLSQDWGTTTDTPRLLAQAGIRFTLDWCNDDQPYWMRTDPGLLSIPLSSEWDDVQCQWLRHVEPRAHAAMASEAFNRLRTECATHQRGAVFGLALHPWVCGMPSRISALRHLLNELRSHCDVHWTSPHAIHAAITESPRHESC